MSQPSQSAERECMAVVGLGYVGLPLATVFAEAGFKVIGLDISEKKVERINRGRSVTPDVPDSLVKALIDSGALVASTDFSLVKDAALISICVPTPLSKSKDPDISYIMDACDMLSAHVSKGSVVVLESTTYPGTTREVILPSFAAKFTIGEDIFLAFSPERIDPGNPTWNVKNTPKVLGGLTEECGKRALALYEKALDKVILLSSAETAEMVKLLENTFRATNIGLVNELAIVCNRLGLSVWEIIDAAATKPFGFMPFRPGPGLGGHCIPIDPLYLSWKMRTLDYKVRFIDLADEVNSEMPQYVLRRVTEILNKDKKAVNGTSILLLGVAYKKDVDDVRESPAIDLLESLEELGARLSYYDPHVPEFEHGDKCYRGITLEEALNTTFDLILIATDHSCVDYQPFADLERAILDTRGILEGAKKPWVHSL